MSGADFATGRRVLVTGLAGSGKSTFSRSLAARTGLPVILHVLRSKRAASAFLDRLEVGRAASVDGDAD